MLDSICTNILNSDCNVLILHLKLSEVLLLCQTDRDNLERLHNPTLENGSIRQWCMVYEMDLLCSIVISL